MRNMSFRHTEVALLAGTKTVTRRVGWTFLKVGDRVRAVRQAQGLKKGERVHVLGVIEIVSVRREVLQDISVCDLRREGFPDLYPSEFVEMYCDQFGGKPWQVVTRIEFRRLLDGRKWEQYPETKK